MCVIVCGEKRGFGDGGNSCNCDAVERAYVLSLEGDEAIYPFLAPGRWVYPLPLAGWPVPWFGQLCKNICASRNGKSYVGSGTGKTPFLFVPLKFSIGSMEAWPLFLGLYNRKVLYTLKARLISYSYKIIAISKGRLHRAFMRPNEGKNCLVWLVQQDNSRNNSITFALLDSPCEAFLIFQWNSFRGRWLSDRLEKERCTLWWW